MPKEKDFDKHGFKKGHIHRRADPKEPGLQGGGHPIGSVSTLGSDGGRPPRTRGVGRRAARLLANPLLSRQSQAFIADMIIFS